MTLLSACEYHMTTIPRVSLFAVQLGLFPDRETDPIFDVRDTQFITSLLHQLAQHGEVVVATENLLTDGKDGNKGEGKPGDKNKSSPAQNNTNGRRISVTMKTTDSQGQPRRRSLLVSLTDSYAKKQVKVPAITYSAEILRSTAVATAQTIFDRLLPDGGHELLAKVKGMAAPERGPKWVGLDEYLLLLLDSWDKVRAMWEEHARYLFHEYCGVFKVLAEATFANDRNLEERDTSVYEVPKSSAAECMRRRLRMFMRTEVLFQKKKPTDDSEQDATAFDEEETYESRMEHIIKRRQNAKLESMDGNPKLEPVVELMSRASFMRVLSIVCPKISDTEVRS
jgi:hypothetical protein